MRPKDETYWKILNSAITLDIRHGHQNWSMTKLAKLSGISRTLIYYYFGKSKLDILEEAVSLFGNELSGSTPRRVALWEQGKLAETFWESQAILKNTPALLPFYFLNRGQKNELGILIRNKESAFRKKIAQFFPQHDPVGHEGIFALFFGICFTSELSEPAVHRAVYILLEGIRRTEADNSV